MVIKKGEIYLVDFDDGRGSEQGGVRPAVVVQNDIGNKHSPTTIVCPLTSRIKKNMPTHVSLTTADGSVERPSTVLCEQVRTTDKTRLLKKLGEIYNQQKKAEITEKLLVAIN